MMLTRLESELALVSVTYAIVTADRMKLDGARRTLADSCVAVFSANCSPLADLQKNTKIEREMS